MRIPWNQFGSIKDINELQRYFTDREYRHTYYFHYTGLKGMDGILGSRSIRISSFDAFNDKSEAKRIRNPKACFGFCFSTGINENLPLWYMYSGLTGEGGRIRLTSKGIQQLLMNATYEFSEKDAEGKPVGDPIPLEPVQMMEVSFKDVLYCGEGNKGNMDFKYNTMTNHLFPLSQREELYERFDGFTKSLIWYYEKETRLLIRLTEKAQKLINPKKNYMVILHFDESVYKMMSITFGPELKDMERVMKEYPHIRTFIEETSRASQSDYAGEIEMNLCRNCNHKRMTETSK